MKTSASSRRAAPAQNGRPTLSPARTAASHKVLWGALLLLSGAFAAWQLAPRSSHGGAPAQSTLSPVETSARRLDYRVVNSFPHDRNAFLQGLLWHDGGFYESTGLEGHSTLRRVAFPSGKVLQSRKLPPEVFGEGLVLVDDRLIQITWQSGVAYVWDRASLRPLEEWRYQGEGWGLTYDGQSLIMSDGSDTLQYRDARNFNILRQLRVSMNGRPLRNLNELEWIDNRIWANIWQTDLIVQIDPSSGRVQSYLDLQGLLPASQRNGREDVLNGIAYDAKTKRLFVGGKLWPRLFQIRVL